MNIKFILALVAGAGAFLTFGPSHQKIMPKHGASKIKPRPAEEIDVGAHIKRRNQTVIALGNKYGELFAQNFCGPEAEAAKKE